MTTAETFTCSDGVVISRLRLRDGMFDCGGGEDEREEDQQSIKQAEKSLLDMLKSNPFDSFEDVVMQKEEKVIVIDGDGAEGVVKEEKSIEIDGDGAEGVVKEEKSIEINGDGGEEEENLTETLLRIRGTNILSGIQSTSISYDELNILYMERRDRQQQQHSGSDAGSGITSAVILQNRQHAVQIVLDPDQLRSLVSGLGQPVTIKTESESGSSGGDNLTVCGRQGGEGGGETLGPAGIALISAVAVGFSINELLEYKKQDKSLRKYIPHRLSQLWTKYGKAGLDLVLKMLRRGNSGGEVVGEKKNDDMEAQELETDTTTSEDQSDKQPPSSAPLKWVVSAGAGELLIVKTEPNSGDNNNKK